MLAGTFWNVGICLMFERIFLKLWDVRYQWWHRVGPPLSSCSDMLGVFFLCVFGKCILIICKCFFVFRGKCILIIWHSFSVFASYSLLWHVVPYFVRWAWARSDLKSRCQIFVVVVVVVIVFFVGWSVHNMVDCDSLSFADADRFAHHNAVPHSSGPVKEPCHCNCV